MQNSTSNEYELNNINVKLIDNNNNVIESIDTYISNSFDAKKIESLDVKIKASLSILTKVSNIVNR